MTTRFLDAPGGWLAYDVDGPEDGRLIVAVHGVGDTRAVYRFLVPRLVEEGYRVATLDVRGHGESSTGWSTYRPRAGGDDVIALIRHLGGGPAMVIGHSSGTASATWAAAEAPRDVDAIVLIAPFVSPVRLSPAKRLAAWPVLHSATLWAKAFYPSLYKAARPADFAAYTRALRRKLAEPGRMEAVRGLLGDKDECNARIPELRCPVLILMGSKDPDYPDAVAEARYAEEIFAPHTTVTVQIAEGAGHYPHVELPTDTADGVAAFLAGAARA